MATGGARLTSRRPLLVLALALVASAAAEARVVRLVLERREPVLEGRPFGLAGAYEALSGTVEFALDPEHVRNQAVVDLKRAPRDAQGEVRFSADFYLIKPASFARGNGRLYYEVPNRGGKAILRRLQYARSALDPREEADFGDGWLMRQGFTLAWMGWQWDVPEQPGLLRLRAPVAGDAAHPITGLVRAAIVLDERRDQAPLGDRGHIAYPAVDPSGPDGKLYVRGHRLDPPRLVPRARWRFADPTTIALDGGFEPGKLYDVVYKSRDPRVAGCAFTATRDLVSFFKNERGPANPLAGTTLAYAHGISQSGRFLRHLIYQGFNEDEEGRRVFDGVIAEVAGAGRGSFNHRFAQASRDGYQHFNLDYPTDVFPFTDLAERDPETGVTAGLLDRAVASGTAPKLFHVMSAFEYWSRAASLVHTDASGASDAPLADSSRVYFMASAQHGPGSLPPTEAGTGGNTGTNPTNPNDYRPALRALVRALDEWVAQGVPPPVSRYPKIADGTLAPPERAGWPALPGIALPLVRNQPVRMDYGPEWPRGIATLEPPRLGSVFPALVPAVDVDGNDRAGVRMPEIEVPLASETGWNTRHPTTGAPDALAGVVGSYFPFARTRAAREASGDPRRSIEERYADRSGYLGRIAEAALALRRERLLLDEDVPVVIERAAAHWDWRATRP
jgi:alpha/beta hydrolase family protein